MRPGDSPVMMAEFASGPALLDGIRALTACGVSRFDAFTPYEVHGLQELLGVRRSRLTWIALFIGLAFGGGAYLLQWWINVVDYPLNIGGRPYHSAPAFIPITWHPVFDIPGFERASIDRFWLAVGAGDAALDRDRDTAALEAVGALRVVWLTSELGAGGAR
ncbi:MAG: DUF3341 domain-containing protein [Deltaproteobacteria bacterium]|nr:MAG: DUF3341 domain-containing protein [Deltaproteobacteria bacterium]